MGGAAAAPGAAWSVVRGQAPGACCFEALVQVQLVQTCSAAEAERGGEVLHRLAVMDMSLSRCGVPRTQRGSCPVFLLERGPGKWKGVGVPV